MQRYKYECDAGCLVLQTDVGEFNIHNEYGDGQFDLTILTLMMNIGPKISEGFLLLLQCTKTERLTS